MSTESQHKDKDSKNIDANCIVSLNSVQIYSKRIRHHTDMSQPQSSTNDTVQIRYNPAYLRTIPGIVKVVCLV